jgi:SMODS and SLOG-associating 2TM effector domain 1
VSDAWRAELLGAYRRHRIAPQDVYYGHNSRNYEHARRWTLIATAVLLVLAALLGALGAADTPRRGMWAFLAAAVAAVATAITSYEAAFGFERYSRQYRDTRLALRLVEARGPRPEDLHGPDADTRVGEFVAEVERLLRSEVDSWSEHVERPDGGQAPA